MPKSRSPFLESERLNYYIPGPEMAEMVLDYYETNADFLKTFSPRRKEEFYTLAYQKSVLKSQHAAAKQGSATTFWLTRKEDQKTLIGFVSLNGIVYGSFRSCYMSYSASAAHARQGLITEAVLQATDFAFQGLQLHRIEINIVPENMASRRVAEKAGYHEEGFSPAYLAIDGIWKDHIHMVRLNPQVTADMV